MDFEQLYSTYFMQVYSYVMTLTGNSGEAEEITQKTFFKAFTAKKVYRGESSHLTYLCSIAKNLFYFRQKREFTQDQLAAKLQIMNVNIDQQMISKIELNKRIVTDYELACLCRALRVSLTDMLSDFYEKYPE